MLQHTVGHRRIIPAYAGSTHWSGVCLGPGWDHPRIRGEHFGTAFEQRIVERIIPAYAGSTEALVACEVEA